MPKVQPEYLELRRQQILDAAAACFARKGFHQSTMHDICAEAELSPGAVYRYFRSKEEIIEGMTARGGSENFGRIATAMEKGDTLTIVEELVHVFFGELADELTNPSACALQMEIISEAPRNDSIREALTRSNREIRSLLVELVSRAQERGEIDPTLDADAVAVAMFALYEGFLSQKLVEPDLDVWRYAEVVLAFFGGSFWRAGQTARSAALQH